MENTKETEVCRGDYCYSCEFFGDACGGDIEMVECSDYRPIDTWTIRKL